MQRRTILLSCLFAAVGIGIVTYIVSHRAEASLFDFLPPCLFHRCTGLHCPGCGGTRAARAIVEGNLGAAAGWNPLLIIGLPLILVAVVFERFSLQRHSRRARVSQITLFVVLLFFLLRNLPTPSTGWLAPRADLFTEQTPSPE